ncbi:HNH endonuclease [Rubritalea halochordaticola]
MAPCGLRIRLPGGHTVVDAAHIIPFSESQDDHPRNGIALCKNHH